MHKIKIRQILTMPRVLALLGLGLLIAVSVFQPLRAQTLTQGYGSDQPLQRGMVVSVKSDDASKVEPATQTSPGLIHGVVVDANDAAVTLSTDTQKVFVATTGHYEVLVSDQNKVIRSGDYLTISSLNGVGMRAGSGDAFVIGRALEAFDFKSGVLSTTDITDKSGHHHAVKLGMVKVDLGVGQNPAFNNQNVNLPSILRTTSQAVAGKAVSVWRVYISLLLILVCTLIAGFVLYGGIRSGIIAIGRNPLSKRSITKSMFQVTLIALIVFLMGLFGVYLLLKL